MAEDLLGKALCLPPLQAPQANESLPAVLSDEQANNAPTDVDDDYELARKNLHTILLTGMKALENMANVSEQSQHPRAYEVLSGLIKNMADTNDKLMQLQRDIKDLEDEPQAPSSPIHVANAVFVGTTNELLEMTRQKRLEKK